MLYQPKDNDIGHTANIVIVGGGVIGLAIARALALRGAEKVCLIERSALGLEASFAAAGMLAPQAEADKRDDFFDLTCRSRDLYPNFAAELREETGVDIQLDQTGTLYVSLDDFDQIELDKRYDWQQRAGLPVGRLNRAQAHELEPCISPSATGALLFPLDFQVDNRRLVSALANSVVKLGVKLLTETSVESLIVQAGRVTGVQTRGGSIGCATVVLAAGTWTSAIQTSSRVPQIEPVRGQMVCLEAKPQLCRHVVYSRRGYLVPRQDGRLLAGSTTENAGFAKQITASGVSKILQHAQEISPAVAHLPISDAWAGLRPRAPDGLPVLGPCAEIDGLFYATGHYRNGILLAPITGELIAQAIVEGVLSSEVSRFSPERFHEVSVSNVR